MDIEPNAGKFLLDIVGGGDLSTIRPTNDLLLIRRIPDEVEVTTSWGFVLKATEDNVQTPLRGLVLAAGLGRQPKLSKASTRLIESASLLLDELGKTLPPCVAMNLAADVRLELAKQAEYPDRVPMQVKTGDTVIFSKHGFQEFRIAGENLIVTQEASILGVIEKGDAS